MDYSRNDEDNTMAQMKAHNERLARVVDAVKARPAGAKISIRKATPSHQVHNSAWKASCHRVDISDMVHVLAFEHGKDRTGAPALLAVCEGAVTMGTLVAASLARGYVPHVVPEYADFTVAGLINGDGIQSSAFRYGVFTHTVTEMEVVLGNGDVRHASTEQDAELFAFVMESYGTMGIVTRASIALRPALPFVRTKYRFFSERASFVAAMDAAIREQRGDFLEGIVMRADAYVVIHSCFCTAEAARSLPQYDPDPLNVNSGERYYYQYVRQVVLGGGGDGTDGATALRLVRPEDAIPIQSFLFRSSRGFYWMMEAFVNWPMLTNQTWFRRYCDRKAAAVMQHSGFEAHGVLSVEEKQRCVVEQDMGIKLNRLDAGIAWVQARLGVYPLWICPVSQKRSLKTSPEYLKVHPEAAKCIGDDYVVDIGVYGEPTVQPFHHRSVLRELQAFVDAPSMWGVTYQSKDAIRSAWVPIRTKYHAIDAFPGVEDKVTYRNAADDLVGDAETSIPNWRNIDQHGRWWRLKQWAAIGAVATLGSGGLYLLGRQAVAVLLTAGR